MSTHVVGFRPPDERWQQMKSIWDMCEEAKIPIPSEVQDFFEGEPPDPSGVKVRLEPHEWLDKRFGSASGFEINLDDLPSDIRIIRFYNSW